MSTPFVEMAYARVSSKAQSLARQEQSILEAVPDLKVQYFFKDKYTGKDFENREQYQNMKLKIQELIEANSSTNIRVTVMLMNWQLVKDEYNAKYEQSLKDFDVEWEKIFSKQQSINVKKAYSQHREIYASDNAVNAIESMVLDVLNVNPTTLSDVEIASLIFQLYYSSRDGMGVTWSKEKNQNIKSYYRAVRNLRNISERMQGVVITQADSMDLIR